MSVALVENILYRERAEELLSTWLGGTPRKVYNNGDSENPMAIVREDFFARRADYVAQGLLGRTLSIKHIDGRTLNGVLSEIAAYDGSTKRTSEGASYQPGIVSISRKHGQYLIDIATGAKDKKDASCITIRALDVEGERIQGPGNVSHHLGLNDGTVQNYEGELAWGRRFWIAGEPVLRGRINWKKGNSDNCMGFYSFNLSD
jgi:3-methyladenine DNA glycosylase Mpg